MLEVVTVDAGTKGHNRYCLAHCRCGCNVVVEVRIGHFLKGNASCPTRRKAANRRAMERGRHIDMMKRINAISQGKNLPEAARATAIQYARRVAADTELQANIRQSFKKDLADRDVKRCAELAGKHTPAPPLIEAKLTIAPEAVKKPRLTPKEIEELEKQSILVRLSGRLVYSVKGEAWNQAGRPPLDTFIWHPETPKTIAPQPEDNLRELIPYLDVNEQGGFVTFSRVPNDKRHLVDKLRAVGILGCLNVLTDKGKAWLETRKPPLDQFVYTRPIPTAMVNEPKKPAPTKAPPLVACRREFVTAEAAGRVRVFPLDRASIGGVGVDVAAKFAS